MKPQGWLKFNRQKRTLLILVLSIFIAPMRGTYLWLKNIKKKNAINFLIEIEVKVAQIESLLNNIIASKESGAPLELLDMLAEYLVVYGIRQRGTDDQGRVILGTPDWHTELGEVNGTIIKNSLEDLYETISQWSERGVDRWDRRVLYELVGKVDRTKTILKKLLNDYTE